MGTSVQQVHEPPTIRGMILQVFTGDHRQRFRIMSCNVIYTFLEMMVIAECEEMETRKESNWVSFLSLDTC